MLFVSYVFIDCEKIRCPHLRTKSLWRLEVRNSVTIRFKTGMVKHCHMLFKTIYVMPISQTFLVPSREEICSMSESLDPNRGKRVAPTGAFRDEALGPEVADALVTMGAFVLERLGKD